MTLTWYSYMRESVCVSVYLKALDVDATAAAAVAMAAFHKHTPSVYN